MKNRFYLPGNFKLKIIIPMSVILVIFSIVGVVFLRANIIQSVMEQVYSENNIKKQFAIKLVDNIIADANKELELIVSSYDRVKKKLNRDDEVVGYLNDLWLKIGNENYIFSYYNNEGDYYNMSDRSNPFDLSSALDIDEMFENLNYTNGKHFFHCMDYCQAYIVRPLSSNDFNSGFVQISITIDSILDTALERMYGLEVVAFRKVDKIDPSGVCLGSHYYMYEYATFEYLYNSFIKKLPDFSCDVDKAAVNTSTFSKNKVLASYFERDGLLFVLLGNAEELLKKADLAIADLTRNAILFAILLMIAFYIMLTIAMRRINVLGEILDGIAKKQFNVAKSKLTKFSRNKRYDEIDDIYHDVHNLASELELAMLDVEDKNQQLMVKMAETQQLADYDTLTGLFNRRKFNQELKAFSETNQSFILVSADLNHFKLVNDSLGHAAGDDLLVAFAKLLRLIFDSHGIVGRMGGDEFSIMLYETRQAYAEMLLESLSNKTKMIFKNNGLGIQVSTSIGAARFPDDSSDIDELASLSDVAMYEHKRLKVGNYHFYNGIETIVAEEREALFWSDLLDISFKQSLYIVYFQPIICSVDSSVFSYEVLARIKNNDNLYTPFGFIQYAEKNRKIILIDKYMINAAMIMGAKMQYPTLNINLSYSTLSDSTLADYMIECSRLHDYPLSSIIIEITESIEIENISLTQDFMKKMRKFGLRFALDDFGTGFSSFTSLAQLGFDYIKIDKSLIKDLMVNESSHYIVKSLVELCQNLNIGVVAEGVENYEILDKVKQYGFELLQGYHFSKPKPVSEYIDNHIKHIELST